MRVKLLAASEAAPSGSNVSRATNVLAVAGASALALTIYESDGSTVVGSMVIPVQTAIVIEKEPDQKITSNATVTKVSYTG